VVCFDQRAQTYKRGAGSLFVQYLRHLIQDVKPIWAQITQKIYNLKLPSVLLMLEITFLFYYYLILSM
jgi:hypothetical protein